MTINMRGTSFRIMIERYWQHAAVASWLLRWNRPEYRPDCYGKMNSLTSQA
jgi:hypothetical protein